MTNLSPAAQAVLDGFLANWQDEPLIQDRQCLVTALRALADQVVPEEDWPDQFIGFADWNLATERCEQRKNIRVKILTIANELENNG